MAIAEKHFRPISKSQKLKPFVLRYGHFVDLNRNVVDEITAVFMPTGKSYTGIDQVELFCHGGSQVVQSILRQLLDSGARAAEPGEFTRLAFLSGRLDLTKAEAVAEIIAANTQSSLEVAREHLLGAYGREVDMLRDGMVEVLAQVEASIDFPEEEISPAESRRLLDLVEKCIDGLTALAESYTGGKIIREGYRVAIGGRPNAGKSSLFNLLLKQERALVTPTAGTTRDYLSEWIDLEGFAVNLVDTAGLRPGGSAIEKAGMQSAKSIIADSNLLIWMSDVSRPKWESTLKTDLADLAKTEKLLLGNKIDLVSDGLVPGVAISDPCVHPVSCLTGAGINELKQELVDRIRRSLPDMTSGVVVTSARHQQKLKAAVKHLKSACSKIRLAASPELTAFDLRQGVNAVDEITGKVYTEQILDRIFENFCIGK